VVEWARDALRHPYDPWQEWAVVHAGELLPDGRPRFREVYLLVARQNGKTEVPVVLSGYWMFVEDIPLILGTSTKLDYAKESWSKLVKLINRCDDPAVVERLVRKWTRDANGEQECWSTDPDTAEKVSRYKIAASNEEGGRSLTVFRLVLDELRQHHTYAAWNAAEPATSAATLTAWGAQIWALSNAGDDNSIVLNEKRDEIIEKLDDGTERIRPDADPSIGWFEWSMPADADPTDPENLAMANPNYNRRIDGEALVRKARAAVRKGGKALTGFLTEYGCIRVRKLDPAIDPGAWARCLDPGTMAGARSRLAVVIDVSPDELHASLIAAAVLPDDRVRVEAVASWEGVGCLSKAELAIPALLARIRPQAFGWLPSGPGAALAAKLKVRPGPGRAWPPPGVTVEEIRGEVPAICMGLSKEVTAGRIAHSDDPLINAHVGGAERLPRPGGTWVFSRKLRGAEDAEGADGHCDAAYATAGAVHLARTLPAPVGKPRLVVAPDVD
jgi:hypothetical protein